MSAEAPGGPPRRTKLLLLCSPAVAAAGTSEEAPQALRRARETGERPSLEAVAHLHRTFAKSSERDPATAVVAAEAMLDLVRSHPGEQVVRFVRRLTRDGHDILELALERQENARTVESRRDAQRLFDEALRTIAVP